MLILLLLFMGYHFLAAFLVCYHFDYGEISEDSKESELGITENDLVDMHKSDGAIGGGPGTQPATSPGSKIDNSCKGPCIEQEARPPAGFLPVK